MTTEQLKEMLERSGADAWELTDTETEGWEFYLIRHKLDQNRIRKVRHIKITLYRKSETGAFLGSASGELSPTAPKEEAEAFLQDLLFRASLVKNPYYTLNKPVSIPDSPAETEPSGVTGPEAIARDFLAALKEVPETETEDLNSCEIFVDWNRIRFLNSEGIDLTESRPASMVEAVVNARKGGKEIELYRMYHSGTCHKEGLVRDLTETLTFGKDRLLTRPTPMLGKMDVVFPTSDAVQIYDWFITRLNASMRYRRFSDWEMEKPIAEEIQGDKVTVYARKTLPNSSKNFAFDPEGAPISDLLLMEEDVPKNSWGGRQFSQYLGLESSFLAGNFEVLGGARPAAELKTGRFLEIVEFSDFQVNPMNGDIAGEIRLAYLHDDGQVIPVSGGSVSGTMRDFVKDMYLSREQRQYNNYQIPAVTRLQNVTVTGAEEA